MNLQPFRQPRSPERTRAEALGNLTHFEWCVEALEAAGFRCSVTLLASSSRRRDDSHNFYYLFLSRDAACGKIDDVFTVHEREHGELAIYRSCFGILGPHVGAGPWTIRRLVGQFERHFVELSLRG